MTGKINGSKVLNYILGAASRFALPNHQASCEIFEDVVHNEQKPIENLWRVIK